MAESVAERVKGILRCLFLVLYYWIVAIVKAVLPTSVQGKDISGETVLITGGGSGIGRLMAIRFAKLKCRIVLWDMNEKGNEETVSLCKEYGATVKAYTIDLCNRDDVYSVANKVKEEVGHVDILMNNAGIVTGKKYLDCPDSMIQKTMEVNAMAHFWTVKSFLPHMMMKNHGHIVTIASSAGFVGVTGLADYCASKFAAVGFDEALRFEMQSLGKDGIHTTVVCPFFINTGMFQGVKTRFPSLLPILEPDYVANKIIEAVQCNQAMLCLPRMLYVLLAVRGFLPVMCLHTITEHMDISHCMDDFKGRQSKQD